jgi:peptidoglycan/xylan/chitin deacetylase (PgdA/CDA1 family)
LEISRRTFLTGAAVAVAAVACGGGSEHSAIQLDPSSTTTLPTTTSTSSTPGSTTSAAPAAPAEFVTHGPSGGSNVALTFHLDGDLALAQQLYDVLASRQVPITAFVVGEWLDANPDWASRLVDAGHELANHTYTHPTFSELSPEAMTDEVVRCRDVIARLTGTGGRCFRPSGTADGTTTPSSTVLDVAAQAGYPVVLGFDVDPLDYQDPGADAVVQRTLATIAPGSVVSLHFGHQGTLDAIPAILDGIEARGLVPVTASALLS